MNGKKAKFLRRAAKVVLMQQVEGGLVLPDADPPEHGVRIHEAPDGAPYSVKDGTARYGDNALRARERTAKRYTKGMTRRQIAGMAQAALNQGMQEINARRAVQALKAQAEASAQARADAIIKPTAHSGIIIASELPKEAA
jgi:hypothetical protein